MIKTYADKKTEQLAVKGSSRYFPQNIIRRALIKLGLIDSAVSVDDLRIPPSNMLEKLSGDRLGQFSIRINRQYKICFQFENTHAYDVEITDYH